MQTMWSLQGMLLSASQAAYVLASGENVLCECLGALGKFSWGVGWGVIFHVGSVPGECLEGHPGCVFRSPCKDYEFLCVAVMTCTILVNTHR